MIYDNLTEENFGISGTVVYGNNSGGNQFRMGNFI